jgi:hypothetical protein
VCCRLSLAAGGALGAVRAAGDGAATLGEIASGDAGAFARSMPRFVASRQGTIDLQSPALRQQISDVVDSLEHTGSPPPGVVRAVCLVNSGFTVIGAVRCQHSQRATTRRTMSGPGQDRGAPVPLLVDAAEPYLVPESRLDDFRGYLASVRVRTVDAEIGGASDATAEIGALMTVLPFPDWCGSSWDSIEEAFKELRQGWSFPLVLVVHGLESLIDQRPHLAFETVIRMSGLSHAFSVAGDQLMVTYVGKDWRDR